jgi:hypothetical protein
MHTVLMPFCILEVLRSLSSIMSVGRRALLLAKPWPVNVTRDVPTLVTTGHNFVTDTSYEDTFLTPFPSYSYHAIAAGMLLRTPKDSDKTKSIVTLLLKRGKISIFMDDK